MSIYIKHAMHSYHLSILDFVYKVKNYCSSYINILCVLVMSNIISIT